MCTTGHKSDDDYANTDSEASSQAVDNDTYDSTLEELISNTRSLSTAEYMFEKRNGRTYHSFQKDLEYGAYTYSCGPLSIKGLRNLAKPFLHQTLSTLSDRNATKWNTLIPAVVVLPNDEPERDRLDMQFWAIHEVLGEYFFAPIGPHPQNILDVGTGTGLWVIDVADSNPGAIVHGTDLSPIQPNFIPPNAIFELHDCLRHPWDFGKEFDLIHTQVISGFAVKNWEEFYREAFQNLRPGGWVESHEFDMMVQTDDDSLPKPSAIVNWILQWSRGAGGGFRLTGEQLADAMRQVGFVDIVVKEFKLPVGTWMKEQLNSGLLTLTAMTEHIEGLSTRIFLDKLGMTEEQMKAQIEPAVKEWKKGSVHTYWPMYAVYGRRPEVAA